MLYRLSRIIPVRFTSEYDAFRYGHSQTRERATWWQWRNHIWRHRVKPVA